MRPAVKYSVIIAFAALSAFVLLVIDFQIYLNTVVTPAHAVTVKIRAGAGFDSIERQLLKNGVITEGNTFYFYSRLKGNVRQIHAGSYTFTGGATPVEVLERLVRGTVDLRRVTIPEGFTLTDIALRLEKAKLADADEVLRLSRNPDFLQQLKIEGESLEGYLFPETYSFAPGTRSKEILRAMVRQMRVVLSEITVSSAPRKLSDHQLLTLASIVQKEAGQVAEMPLIAAVFHNRLKRGMLLQSDPTVIYGLKKFNGNLTRKHLKTPTPFNTYTQKGLPPGPIASPGRAALQAVISPADVSYLYFVGKGDGTHFFSRTLREHNNAVRKYQLRRRRK